MELVNYQNECFKKLYTSLVNDGQHLIVFTGARGCGKSVIIDELADNLKENWKVFLITGTGATSPPYYTWYAMSHKITPRKEKHISNISFGVNFQPVGLPIGLEIGLGFDSQQTLLDGNELAIAKAISHEINDENVLFIAEDYESWDQASKNFLSKIALRTPNILGKVVNIHVLLVSSSVDNIVDICNVVNSNVHEISIDNIDIKDITLIINQQPNLQAISSYDLENIIPLTGYDLRLINLAVRYQQSSIDNIDIKTINELLDKRISYMSVEQKKVCKTLENVSIINCFFSEKEAAYLLDQEPVNAEKLLDAAVKLNFIRKRHEYDFPIPIVQKYFEEKLDIEKKYLHYKFAQYLLTHRPEDYLNRSSHLFFSEKANGELNVFEAAYLLAIEIVRRKEITNNGSEDILTKKLTEMICQLPLTVRSFVDSNIKAYQEGFFLLSHCDYANSIIHFSGLHHMYASKAFSIDTLRCHLLCQVQLADDLFEIKRLADELYNHISDVKFIEDEIWCRSALLLLEVYGDRHIQKDRFQFLISGFESRIRKHINQSTFRSLYAKYTCKSALFFNSMIAVKLTEDSCEYYRTYNSTLNLYFSLCNNAANRIVCGDYKEAEIRLNECKMIMKETPNIRFPSAYKVENNIIINSFLQSEGQLFDDSTRIKRKILTAAVKAANKLELIKGQQGYEVSRVIEFNLLSMYMLSEKHDKTKQLLHQFEMEYKYLDTFYKYYFHNSCCVNNIVTGNYSDAMKHLEILETLDVILLSGFSKILLKRNQIIRQLISEKFTEDSFCLNYEFIRRGIHVQDPSASFWGRGFLLSDLQFLSF